MLLGEELGDRITESGDDILFTERLGTRDRVEVSWEAGRHNMQTTLTFAHLHCWGGIVKDGRFHIEDAALGRAAAHEVLGALIDEIPPQVCEADKVE
jgi:hypothetical protein